MASINAWLFESASVKGQLLVIGPKPGNGFEWHFYTGPVDPVYKQGKPYFYLTEAWGVVALWLPHLHLLLGVGILAAVPWIPLRRFSLRALLIGMTVLAVLLGLIAWTPK